jgi:hypothetical protein
MGIAFVMKKEKNVSQNKDITDIKRGKGTCFLSLTVSMEIGD